MGGQWAEKNLLLNLLKVGYLNFKEHPVQIF